jgi:hypothetical protein
MLRIFELHEDVDTVITDIECFMSTGEFPVSEDNLYSEWIYELAELFNCSVTDHRIITQGLCFIVDKQKELIDGLTR